MTQLDLYPILAEDARQQFDSEGHVAVQGLFDAAQAGAVLAELNARVFRHHPGGPGEQITPLKGMPSSDRGTAFDALFERISDGAATLGESLEPELGWGINAQLLRMEAGGRGRVHTDCPMLGDVTAIANLEGSSSFRVINIGQYRLETGDAVFIRGQEMWHQGLADQGVARTGLAVARIALQKPK
jgi:hypothetical protein